MTNISKFFSFIIVTLLTISIYNCKSENRTIPEGFQIEDGFNLSLVVSEPIIKDPVDIEFDQNGHAYVLEMPGYPFEDTESKIVKLIDKNQDGKFEDGITYAEDLQLASSILPYKNGMLVAAPPFLLYLKDNNGDQIADQRDTILDGFSTGNLQHNFNGLTYGLDNWIYIANGGNSGKPFWYGDSTTVIDLKGNDLRINLDLNIMETIGHSSGGYELTINEWGHIFETHNLEHVSQLVFPSTYIKGNKIKPNHTLVNISNHEENGLARIYPIGEQESRVNHPEQSGYFSGSCGITYYGGSNLGKTYDNTIWVADVVLNLLHVDKLEAYGSRSNSARLLDNKDFLASTDRSFRPVNMTVGPDGSMYVVDMYREVIEHPEWIPDEMEAKLDLEAGKDKGRIYKISKNGHDGLKIDYSLFHSNTGLIKLLSNDNQWVRNNAHRLLIDNSLGQNEIAQLENEVGSNDVFAKLHGLWILHTKQKLDLATLVSNLEDEESGIKENVLKIAESYLNNDEVIAATINLLNDSDQRVRMQAALTISTLDNQNFAKHKSSIIEGLTQATTQQIDEWNTIAITIAAKTAKLDLFNIIANNKPDENQIKLLKALALSSSNRESDLKSMLTTLGESELKDESISKIIASINNGNPPTNPSRSIVPEIIALEKDASISLTTNLASLRKKLGLRASAKFIENSKLSLDEVLNSNLSTRERMEHLEVLGLLDFELKEEVLFSLISNKEPLNIQEAALQQIWQSEKKHTGIRLVEAWSKLGPQARRSVSDILLYKELHHDALLSGLEQGKINIGEMNFDLERRRTLLWWTDNEQTKKRAEALFSDSGVVNRKEVIHKMSPALALNGNHVNGEELFDNLCGQCHLYGSIGEDVGPVLTEINRKSKESLMHDILDPNAAVDTKYINHKLETTSGDIHIGIVANESDHEITIKKLGGSEITITKSEIKYLSSLGSSMMPEGMEGNLDEQQMADLLAFLQRQPT